MKTIPGVSHESARGGRRKDYDLCARHPSADEVASDVGLGSAPRGNGSTLASGRQERGWGAWAKVACGVVCAGGGLDVGQDLARASNGRIPERERGGAAVLWAERAARVAGARPFQSRTSLGGVGNGRGGGSQPVGNQTSARAWLYEPRAPLLGHHGTRTADRLSARTRDSQRTGRARRARVDEFAEAWSAGRTRCDRD